MGTTSRRKNAVNKTICIDGWLAETLEEIKEETGMTISEQVNTVLKDYFGIISPLDENNLTLKRKANELSS